MEKVVGDKAVAMDNSPVTIRVWHHEGRSQGLSEEYTAYNAVGVVTALQEIMEPVGTTIAKIEVSEDRRELDLWTEYVLD